MNEVRAAFETALGERRDELERDAQRDLVDADRIDLTLPGRRPRSGSLHPFTLIEYEIVDIFTRMGYRVVEGLEVEDEWHNFDALNIPPDHPARTSMDTTFVDVPGHPELLLRTHTSPMRSGRWSRSRRPCTSSCRDASTATRRSPPRTCPCSTRSKVWRSPRASPSRT